MEELNRKLNWWVEKHLIPQLTKNESNVKFTIARPSGNYFLSDPFFMTLHSPKNGEKKIVAKLPSQDPDIIAFIDYDTLFANEILFYKEIAYGDTDYPQCYLAGKDPVFKAVIILEDVRPRGYVVSPNKVDVHLDYIVAGLRAIARFHALTYATKEKEPEKFRKLLQSMHDSRFCENPLNERFRNTINESCQRPIQRIRARNDNSELTTKLCDLFDDAFVNVMMKCVRANEPLATIIHGDCTINNLLFRRDKKNNEDSKLEAMLIDFGLLMHSSPVLDVSILLYMTCTREDIRDRAKELFEVYHSCLADCMKERGIWDASKYSLEIFWRDYHRRAVFGYLVAAFFRGTMTVFDREHEVLQVESMSEWYNKDGGGEEVSILLVDMLDDLRDAGMLEDFIGK